MIEQKYYSSTSYSNYPNCTAMGIASYAIGAFILIFLVIMYCENKRKKVIFISSTEYNKYSQLE